MCQEPYEEEHKVPPHKADVVTERPPKNQCESKWWHVC